MSASDSAAASAGGLEAVVGATGRWQVQQSVLISLVGILCAWHVLGIVFLAAHTEHSCVPPEPPPAHWSKVANISQCHIYVYTDAASAQASAVASVSQEPEVIACSNWEYDSSEYVSTVITEWDLVCDRHWLQMGVKSVYMVGIMFGVMMCGIFADRYGRRPALLGTLLLTVAFSAACAAAMDAWSFIVLRFLSAFFGIGLYTTGFVLSMELFGDRWRPLMGITYCLPLSFGFMTVGGLGYLIRDWRWFQLATSLPGLVFFVLYWLVPESPRWLLSRGRAAEANQILDSICKYNGTAPMEKAAAQESPTEEGAAPKESFFQLLRNARALVTLGTLFFCWFVNSLVFYAIVLQTGVIGGNIYVNATLGGVAEVPALLTVIFAIYRLGRRAPICLNMVGAGLACLLTLAFKKGDYEHDWPLVLLALMGRFCITASYSTIYIYTAELFPTSVRNTCLAVCSVGSRIGGIVAPFCALLREVGSPAAPVLMFAGMSISSGLSIVLMPETAGRPLPERIADMSHKHRHQGGANKQQLYAAVPPDLQRADERDKPACSNGTVGV